MWPVNKSKLSKFNDFIQMVVCLCVLHKDIKSRTTAIFVIFLKRIFLKIPVSFTLRVVNRPNKKFVLVTIFFILFFAIICYKKSCLFGKIWWKYVSWKLKIVWA